MKRVSSDVYVRALPEVQQLLTDLLTGNTKAFDSKSSKEGLRITLTGKAPDAINIL